jgi:hypothetical protein
MIFIFHGSDSRSITGHDPGVIYGTMACGGKEYPMQKRKQVLGLLHGIVVHPNQNN